MFVKVLMVLVFLRNSGILFDIEEPTKESAFFPVLIFQKGQVNFR